MKIIKIKDYCGNYQCVPVDDVFYEEWRKMQAEEYNIRRREWRHGSTLEEDVIDALYCNCHNDSLFDEYVSIEENIKLYQAIKKLTPIQRRRIYMLLDDMSYTDIARAEGRDLAVVYRSIRKALGHLRRIMEE